MPDTQPPGISATLAAMPAPQGPTTSPHGLVEVGECDRCGATGPCTWVDFYTAAEGIQGLGVVQFDHPLIDDVTWLLLCANCWTPC